MSSMTCTGTKAETGTKRIPPAPHPNAATTMYPRCTARYPRNEPPLLTMCANVRHQNGLEQGADTKASWLKWSWLG